MRQLALRLTFITATFAGTAFSIAQDAPPAGSVPDQEVESLYDQLDQQSDQAKKKEDDATKPDEKPADKKTDAASKPDIPEAKTITDLNQLQPFSDIAVIERRFLPKTHRFELSGIGLTNLNNPFFNNIGGSVKGAFYLTEQYAIEAIGTGLSVASRQATVDLKSENINTSNVVTARSFFGAGLKWNPVYGKISFLNRSIVPFDLSFSLAGGMTQTDQNRQEPTVHLGTSQVFAINKSFGVRWDLDWNFYRAEKTDTSVIPNTKSTIFQNDLFLGVGVSFYFPGASYR